MEIVKPEPEQLEAAVESNTDVKLEVKPVIKEELDGKSIDSDTELMKILEEDNTISEESKAASKKGDLTATKDGPILMDALTKNGGTGEDKLEQIKIEDDIIKGKLPEIKQEQTINNDNDIVNNGIVESMPVVPLQEPEAPLQPFIPEPEAPIDPDECRLRLLEHIDHFQSHIEARLDTLEAQCAVLEAMDDADVSLVGVLPREKQTIQMLVRDLNTVRKLAALC